MTTTIPVFKFPDYGDCSAKRYPCNDAREVWSLFSGAMGLDLGLEHSGLTPTLACEIEKTYCQTIRLNRRTSLWLKEMPFSKQLTRFG